MRLFIGFCIFILLALLEGCTLEGVKNHLTVDIAAKVQPLTLADLDLAIADATAAGDVDGLACWVEAKAYVQSWPTPAPHGLPNVGGVASGIQAARTARLRPAPGLPPIPASMHRACAVVIVDANRVLGRLGITAAAQAKGLPVPPDLQP